MPFGFNFHLDKHWAGDRLLMIPITVAFRHIFSCQEQVASTLLVLQQEQEEDDVQQFIFALYQYKRTHVISCTSYALVAWDYILSSNSPSQLV